MAVKFNFMSPKPGLEKPHQKLHSDSDAGVIVIFLTGSFLSSTVFQKTKNFLAKKKQNFFRSLSDPSKEEDSSVWMIF